MSLLYARGLSTSLHEPGIFPSWPQNLLNDYRHNVSAKCLQASLSRSIPRMLIHLCKLPRMPVHGEILRTDHVSGNTVWCYQTLIHFPLQENFQYLPRFNMLHPNIFTTMTI